MALLLLALTVPLLYAAGMGPACRWGSAPMISIAYWPLIAACDETPLEEPLCTWIGWWHPEPDRRAGTMFDSGEVVQLYWPIE